MPERPMKIAYVHTQPFDIYEAGTVFSTNTARGIAEAGAKSLFIASDAGEPVDQVLGKLGLSPHPDLEIRLIRGLRLRVGPLHGSWSGPFRKAAVRAAREFGADAVICRDLKMAKAFLDERFEGRVIYEVHNVYSLGDDERNAAFFPAEKLRMHATRAPMEDDVFARVDGVIALTQGLADILVRTKPVSQRVLAAGSASRPLVDPSGTADRRHIAYVGALDPHKGVGGLVRVMDRLPPRARLLIFGKGRHLESIKEIARTVGAENRIDYTGFVMPVQLPHHLGRCRAGVVPLVDVFFNRYVSSPMKVFDYLASGVVPVVPDLPVFREIFRDESPAEFFEPGNDESMARAITHLFEDDAIFRRRHLAALHQASEWTWRQRGERIVEFVRELPFREERKPRPRPA